MWLIAAGMMRLFTRVGTSAGSFWRLGLNAVMRRRWQSRLQMTVIALVLTLVGGFILIRTALIVDWQKQLPKETPNHFLINVKPAEVASIADYFSASGIKSDAMYPMVRGRLTEINGSPVRQVVSKEQRINALNRELNLSWRGQLPAENTLLEGRWWPQTAGSGLDTSVLAPQVSIESKLASKLGVTLGDTLTFTLGSEQLEATVSSIRKVRWDSMKPNFYMLFSPGALDQFPVTYITSFYLHEKDKGKLNVLSRQYPTVTLLAVDHFIKKIQQLMQQVSMAVELLLFLMVVASLLVIIALVNVTYDERLKEGALLRALGAKKMIIAGGQWVEFGCIGFIGGLVALVGAELMVWAVQWRLFQLEFVVHGWLWVSLPLVSLLVVGLLGTSQVRQIWQVSPMKVLRQTG